MNYLTNAYTDVGIKKKTNQDSHAIKVVKTPKGNVCLAIMCDGMGGLAKGEVASSYVVGEFSKWFVTDFPVMLSNGNFSDLMYQWNNIVQKSNVTIADYAKQFKVSMGTTLTVVLFVDNKGYTMHIGDTRLYAISQNKIGIFTEDQTLVAREVKKGNLTPEQAEIDPRRSILLQCIGASRVVEPQFFQFDVEPNMTFMLCSDGFRHKITNQEIFNYFAPQNLDSKQTMLNNSKYLVDLNKSRNETDNITTLLIKTY